MIENTRLTIKRTDLRHLSRLPAAVTESLGKVPLRWYIAKASSEELIIEATTCDGDAAGGADAGERPHYPGKSVILSLIPTGIGCSIGGYAGDAAPVTNLLASSADYLITNPNAVNASDFIGLDSEKIVYTEGSCIDLFCRGAADLYLPYSNKIGVIIEKASDARLEVAFNVLNAIRAVHGVHIVDYVITEQPIGGRCVQNKSGAFVGTLDNPGVLFDACERLIGKGANAIAITSDIQDLPLENYAKHFAGEYPNPVGGVEAVISHLVTRRFRIPAAHAPLMNIKSLDFSNRVVDARGAGEMTSESGFACVLVGLRRAPQIQATPNLRVADIININNLLAVVAPASALGGIPILCAHQSGIPVIAVEENSTILDVTREKLGLDNVIHARSYAEAAGLATALRRGICLETLTRPLTTIRF